MGAAGSKGSSAQRAVSRAAAAAAKPGGSSGGGAAAGVSAAELERSAELRARAAATPAAPPEQRQDTQPLVESMNKVMAGLHQYQYEVYRNPEVDKKYALKRKTKEEREAELVGRLSAPALKALLEEHGRSVRAGKPLSAAELARRYGANEEVLAQVLKYNAAPVLYSARDGRVHAKWPDGRDE